jgi:iron complex outermembrane recepter protein
MMREKLAAAAMCAAFITLSAAQAAENTAGSSAGDQSLEEVVVTGVLVKTKLQDAPIAISTVTSEEIAKQAPVSAADLLKNVPGVFVNSSLGEIRNVVFSRGVSANSLDAASGYYYVSLQEDGLPVTNVTFTNYGPDYLYRPDITLGRLEALRGGTASLTGPNAPGGIFNYISRTGKDNPGMEIRGRYGMEGDLKNPFYRGDFYAGGLLGADGWSYSVGGFYRKAVGARDPGYDLNKGGQIKGNVAYDYANGSVQIYAKLLDDHNGWFEFLPAKNYSDPKLVAGIASTFSFLPPPAPHAATLDGGASYETWDGSKLVESKSKSIGVKWNHDFGNGWAFANNAKYADNSTDWNTGAVIFPVALDDWFNYILLNAVAPGTFTFKNHQSGAVLATVNSVFNPALLAFGLPPFDHIVTSNNLPNQSVLANGVLTQAALLSHNKSKEFMDQMSVTRTLDTMSFTLGVFYARSDTTSRGGGSGLGLSPIENKPQLMDITLTTPGGTVQQVTSPQGFVGIGDLGFGLPRAAVQTQTSLFFGHNWKFASAWTLDWGVRYENMKVSGGNSPATVPLAVNATGGLDGNPNTLYDNNGNTPAPNLTYSKSLSFTNYTAALSRKFDGGQMAYLRYSDGKKAPDLDFYRSLTSTDAIRLQDPVPQHIQQFELGYRLVRGRYNLSLSPFYSKLSDVGNAQIFTDQNNVLYTPPPLYSTTTTLGIEAEGSFKVSSLVQLRTSVTLQDPQSKDYRIWIHNNTTRLAKDDTIASTPDGLADNNPKLMANTTITVAPSAQVSTFLTWQYMGSRAANRYNTFFLPAFSQFNLGATYEPTKKLSIGLNVNNLFNVEGVMSWAKAGSFLAALDRQAFTPADRAANPNATFSVVTVQPRAAFLTVGYKLN